jgi:hypothetical protein
MGGSQLAVLLQVLPKTCNCWCCSGVWSQTAHTLFFRLLSSSLETTLPSSSSTRRKKKGEFATHIAADGLITTLPGKGGIAMTTGHEGQRKHDGFKLAALTSHHQGAVGWSGVVPEEGQRGPRGEKRGLRSADTSFDGGFSALFSLKTRPPPVAALSSLCLQCVPPARVGQGIPRSNRRAVPDA